MPLDSEGFLRRRCQSCSREFKWLHTPDGSANAVAPPPGGYYCPYCGIQSHEWMTDAQSALVNETVQREAVQIAQRQLNQAMKDAVRGSKFLSYKESPGKPMPEPHPLSEDDDMKRIDFQCHPTEPIKIEESWSGSLYCLICSAEITV